LLAARNKLTCFVDYRRDDDVNINTGHRIVVEDRATIVMSGVLNCTGSASLSVRVSWRVVDNAEQPFTLAIVKLVASRS
jgi:hypothetical protein